MPLSQTFCLLSLPSKNNCTEGPQWLEICLICNEKRAGGSRLFLFDNEVFGRAHFLITNYNEKRAGNCASGKTFPWAKGCIFFPLCSLSLSWTIRHVWFRFLAVFLTSCDSIIISAFFVNIFLGVHHFSDFFFNLTILPYPSDFSSSKVVGNCHPRISSAVAPWIILVGFRITINQSHYYLKLYPLSLLRLFFKVNLEIFLMCHINDALWAHGYHIHKYKMW